MAAGGFRTFVAGETLDEDKINDFLMQGILVFADAAARDAAITAPVEGQFAFRKDDDVVEFYDGTGWEEFSAGGVEFDFLVIAGGGGGGGHSGDPGFSAAGAGAGGYRTSAGTSGGTASAEPANILFSGVNYTVTVGAGGSGGAASGNANGTSGAISRFAEIISYGGGGGGGRDRFGVVGGSGGGGGAIAGLGAAALAVQGFAGSNPVVGADRSGSGAGGGAGAVGANPSGTTGGAGGAGLASTITGTSVTRGGGGGGGGQTGGAGGSGGGGAGGSNVNGSAGTENTGGGGGGAGATTKAGGNGGSGIVVLKYPDNITLTIGAGLTSSTASAGGFKVTQFTAGTDTVSF